MGTREPGGHSSRPEPINSDSSTEGSGSGDPGGKTGGDSEGDREFGGNRPTPVRLAMDGSGAEPQKAPDSSRTIRDPQEDGEWLVTEAGRAGSGVLPLRSVALLEVVFSRPEDPDTPVRSILTQGRSVDDLGEEELLALLRHSGAVRWPTNDPSLSKGGDRRRRGKMPPKG